MIEIKSRGNKVKEEPNKTNQHGIIDAASIVFEGWKNSSGQNGK
jgi:hypothetical protein